MFDSIIEKAPELFRLEQAVAELQQQQAAGQAKVAALSNKVAQAAEDDLNREALALNRGSKAPKPKEPELREQLERAQRELAILERRQALAGSDRGHYIRENSEELMGLLAGARAEEGERVAEGAAKVLADLLRYFKCEDDARALGRLAPAPAALENTGEPQQAITVWGPMTTQNVTGGPARGDLEGSLRYLASLGSQAETIVGDAGAQGQ